MVSCVTPGNVENVVTELRYGPGGQLLELIARNPATGDQVTRYEYGVTLAESGIASNDLLRAEIYPDSTGSSDRVSYSYNRQGQRIQMQDQNGSVHEYEYDSLGRQTADKVATLGAGVDGAVRRIGTTYEVRGMVEKVTSYSDAAGTTPVNEVQNVYNSFGQFQEQYQEHSGSVNTGTTPKVVYSYADGSANTIRPTSMTYPSGRVLEYLYDDTAADKLSRIRTLRWDETDVCRYSYLGLSTFVMTDYLQPQVKLDYALGSGANPYAGFDRFGRIIDLLWAKYGASGSSSSSSSGGAGEDLVHLKYGYDRASSRTHREDLVAQGYGKDFDELYGYDGLHRLKKFHRGRLTDDNQAITSPTFQQGWQLDATGNWQNFTQNDQADPDQTLDQQRLANRVNEITQIARTVGADWATPEYDRNGNMTVIPQPKEMTQTFQGTWDAWNRLVKLTEPNGSGGWQTLAEYQYDGQTWRIVAKSYASGVLDETRHFYFTNRWQDIEERLGSTPSSAAANRQFVWGERYIDDLVLRDRDASGGTLDERLYGMQDANWNVVLLATNASSADAVARNVYDAYGNSRSFNGSLNTQLNDTAFEWEYRFAGRQYDLESGMYGNRYRDYHCRLGRFNSRDPLPRSIPHILNLLDDVLAILDERSGIAGAEIVRSGLLSLKAHLADTNLYAYASGNPTTFVDPFGLQSAGSPSIPAPPDIGINPGTIAAIMLALQALRAALMANIWNIAIAIAITAAITCIVNGLRVCVPAYNKCAGLAYGDAAVKGAKLCVWKGGIKELREINQVKCITRIYGKLTRPPCDVEFRWCMAKCGLGGFNFPNFKAIVVPPGFCADLCAPAELACISRGVRFDRITQTQ
jgi:RHS repeat-associated protein